MNKLHLTQNLNIFGRMTENFSKLKFDMWYLQNTKNLLPKIKIVKCIGRLESAKNQHHHPEEITALSINIHIILTPSIKHNISQQDLYDMLKKYNDLIT